MRDDFGGCIEGGIAVFAIGFGLLQPLDGQTGYPFLAFQQSLDINIPLVGFVAVLVHCLGLVLGDDGFYPGIKLDYTSGGGGGGVLEELQTLVNVGGETFVYLYVIYLIVNHVNSLNIEH